MHRIRAIPPVPVVNHSSPKIVHVLDDIRFRITNDENLSEFYWFIREYPRVFRHHVSHVAHRLKAIHQRYVEFHALFAGQLGESHTNLFSTGVSDARVYQIYWDFEAMLNAVGAALDVLARILSTVSKDHTPPNFNKFIKAPGGGNYSLIMMNAKDRWVQRMKDYRDCFVHYTSVDTLLHCTCSRYSNEWQVRCKLPINPNARDIVAFRWARRYDVLTYAISVWRNLQALDRRVAAELAADFRAGRYPVRTSDLFNIGIRMPKKATTKAEPKEGIS